MLVEERPTHAHSDAPQEVHQLSVATCQPAVGRATWTPLDKRSPIRTYVYIPANVRMTRRTSGTDLKPVTPTAGNRTRPRAAFRTLGVLSWGLFRVPGWAGSWGHSLVERKPASPPSCNAGPPRLQAALPFNTRTLYSLSFNFPPRQPQVEVRVVIGSHGPPSDLLKPTPTSAGFFQTLLDVYLGAQVGRVGPSTRSSLSEKQSTGSCVYFAVIYA